MNSITSANDCLHPTKTKTNGEEMKTYIYDSNPVARPYSE